MEKHSSIATPSRTLPRPPVFGWLGFQACMLIVVTVLVWQWQMVVARSMLLGGAVYLLPQTWFAWQAFRFQGARSAFSMVRAFYRGEAGKYILTAALFAVVFATVRPLDVPAMFGAYIGLMVINVVMTAARAHR